jgi:hypothetical protein
MCPSCWTTLMMLFGAVSASGFAAFAVRKLSAATEAPGPRAQRAPGRVR